MRLRRIEFVVIALTLAFVCFMGGYFAGSKGAASIVAAPLQYEQPQQETTTSRPAEVRDTSQHETAAIPAAGTPDAAEDEVSAGAEDKSADLQDGKAESPDADVKPDSVPAGAPKGGDGKININSASRSELMDLPGIGTVLAGRIVDYRSQYGAFSTIEDIKRVSGIGEKRFEAIMNSITV